MKVIRNATIALFAGSALALAGVAVAAKGSKHEGCSEMQSKSEGGKHQHGNKQGTGAGHHGTGAGHQGKKHEHMAGMHERMGRMHGNTAPGSTEGQKEEHKH